MWGILCTCIKTRKKIQERLDKTLVEEVMLILRTNLFSWSSHAMRIMLVYNISQGHSQEEPWNIWQREKKNERILIYASKYCCWDMSLYQSMYHKVWKHTASMLYRQYVLKYQLFFPKFYKCYQNIPALRSQWLLNHWCRLNDTWFLPQYTVFPWLLGSETVSSLYVWLVLLLNFYYFSQLSGLWVLGGQKQYEIT